LSLTRLIQGLLFGVPPHDPITLGIVAVMMAIVGIGACWIPAIRASRIEPAVALRAS
jgi:ABC-type lipoprotein release transport system permease subunit